MTSDRNVVVVERAPVYPETRAWIAKELRDLLGDDVEFALLCDKCTNNGKTPPCDHDREVRAALSRRRGVTILCFGWHAKRLIVGDHYIWRPPPLHLSPPPAQPPASWQPRRGDAAASQTPEARRRAWAADVHGMPHDIVLLADDEDARVILAPLRSYEYRRDDGSDAWQCDVIDKCSSC